jgi:inward rectifier potassium channel
LQNNIYNLLPTFERLLKLDTTMGISKHFKNIRGASQELGFGTKITNQSDRMLNKDGSFNVKRKGLRPLQRISVYHYMVTATWYHFLLVILSAFVAVNLIFTAIYLAFGVQNLNGMIAHNPVEEFFEAFFFSAQTFTTVGYGRINPTGILESGVASLEALVGLLFFAVATGLMYGRFSRPVAKFQFSDNMIVAPYKDITALQYRVANRLNHQLIDVEAQISFSILQEVNGISMRKFYTLELELKKVSFFPTNWTINHPIDIKSPMWGLTEADLKDGEAEFLIIMKAYDENFSQMVNVRSSYTHQEVVWGAKWKSMLGEPEDGKLVLLMDKIGDYEKAQLPALNVQIEDDATDTPQHQAVQMPRPDETLRAK